MNTAAFKHCDHGEELCNSCIDRCGSKYAKCPLCRRSMAALVSRIVLKWENKERSILDMYVGKSVEDHQAPLARVFLDKESLRNDIIEALLLTIAYFQAVPKKNWSKHIHEVTESDFSQDAAVADTVVTSETIFLEGLCIVNEAEVPLKQFLFNVEDLLANGGILKASGKHDQMIADAKDAVTKADFSHLI